MRAIHLVAVVAVVVAGACERGQNKPAPLYTARAYLEVLPEVALQPGTPSIEWAGSTIEERLRTHAALIKAEPILIRAMADSEVQQTVWYRESPDTAVARLRDILRVYAIPDTALIAVVVTTYDPVTAAALANAVATAYVDDHTEFTRRVYDEHLTNLHAEKEERQAEIDRLIDVFSSEAGVAPSQGEQIRLEELVRELTRQEVTLTNQFRAAQSLHERLQELQEQGALAEAPEVLDRLNADPSYAQLLKLKSEASAGLQQLLAQYNEDHPAVIEATERLQTIEEQLGEMTQLASDIALVDAESNVLELMLSREQVARELEVATQEMRRIGAATAQLANRRAQFEELNGRLARISEMIAETKLLRDRAPTVRLQQRATVPTEPSRTE